MFQSKNGTAFLDGTLNSIHGEIDEGEFSVNFERKFVENSKEK